MIIIFCPKSIATGGTELLHQLGYKLNLFGFEAGIYYYGDESVKETTSPNFVKYAVPAVEKLSDSDDNIFVYPEALVTSLEATKVQMPKSKHVLWWLSVDNAGMTPELEDQISKDNDLIHFVQSYYAHDYVKNILRIPDERIFYLSDYLSYDYLNVDNTQKRDDTVLFNPRKGFDRTAVLIGNSDHRIKWRALNGLAQKDVPDVLRSAKVYIDFGNHPGKDRFPREAVACGCRIITGRRGSAANEMDIPIIDRLKVPDNANDGEILMLIYTLLQYYDSNEDLYRNYKKLIDEEFHTFEADMLSVFSKLVSKEPDGMDLDEDGLKSIIVDAVSAEEYKKALYYITVYRIKGFEISEDMLILEGYTRLGLDKERKVALYLMRQLLGKNSSNYEAYLIMGRTLTELGMDGADEAFDKAVECSIGSCDEEYVREAVSTLRGGSGAHAG